MDPAKIIVILEGTMNPTLRKEAESKLEEMHKIAGFAPLLLQIIMSDEIHTSIRQAGAIYLKNMVSKWWQQKTDVDGDPITDIFHIHENDKTAIRENIVEAITHATEVIRNQLTTIVHHIIKEDFPDRWPGIVDKISGNLQDDPNKWMGALLTLYQLVKNYEYKKPDERQPLMVAMKIFLPALSRLFQQVLDNESAQSVLLQKQSLKILYALVQYSLPLKLFDETTLDGWMHYMQVIVERDPPEETLQVDILERPELPWWKCKKWAMHILARVFERYGSPGCVSKEYTQFSEFFLKRYTVSVTRVLLKVLDGYRHGKYVSPRVLQQAMHFLEQGVSHAQTWKVMKDVYLDILKDIIFPLMCFTDEDRDMWNDDPHEYVRVKFDVFEDFLSPSSAAQCLLQSACTKRKQVLQKTMTFCHSVLMENGANFDPRRKDGALHIIGSLASTLMKRKMYKDQLELMLAAHVLPELKSETNFMRARAAWVTQHFSEARFKHQKNLFTAADGVKALLVGDQELPVRVEAAFALQALLCEQEKVEKHCEPEVGVIIQNLLQLVHETENDDLTSVVQKIICLYCEQVIPYAVEITKNLVMTFLKMLSDKDGNPEINGNDEDAGDDKAVAAMGVLNTIETVLDTMEEQRDITIQLEGIVVPIIAHVLKNRIIDFYEEIFSLMYSLTCQAISAQMWEALPLICEVFEDDGFDYFSEMMPVLHNFCTIDTKVFLSNPKYLEIIYSMCKKVLDDDAGEDPESHAAKLLEVIILQCRGQIDQCIPIFTQTALSRLTREVKTSELRTMCLQVVVAAIYYNPILLIQTLENMKFPNTTESVTDQFFRQWLKDADCFLGIHDRRVAVLGLCALLDMNNRPQAFLELTPQILPSMILIFQGLTRAYRNKGEGENSSDSDSDDEDADNEYDQQELASSEDEVDEESAEYLEMLEKKASSDYEDSIYSDEETDLESFASKLDDASDDTQEFMIFKKAMLSKINAVNGDDDDCLDEDAEGETALEIYTSSLDDESSGIDEYTIFKQILSSLESRDSSWYAQLVSGLTDDQRKALQEIYTLADQRLAAAESKKIEKTGGYQFNTTNVPTSFNFSSGLPPPTLSP